MSDFRVTLKTSDGSLVLDHVGDADCYFRAGEPDEEFILLALNVASSQLGVHVMSHNITHEGVSAIVVR